MLPDTLRRLFPLLPDAGTAPRSFYAGRRLAGGEDERQIARWNGVCGDKGRWKQNLIAKCLRDGKSYDDQTVSPVVRQTLLHWAYELQEADFRSGAKRVKSHGASYVPRDQLSGIVKRGGGKSEGGGGEEEEEESAAKKAAGNKQGREERAKRRVEGGAAATAGEGARPATKRRAASSSSAAAPPPEPLSEYEKQRDATKARNQRKLEELGLA